MTKNQIALFCEGKASSLDYQIYAKLIADIAGNTTNITLIPLGSVRGSYKVVEGYLMRRGIPTYNVGIFLRDRDFDFSYDDFPLPNLVEVKPTKGKEARKNEDINAYALVFATARITIENYLLDAELLWEYLKIKSNEENKSLILTQKEIFAIFKQAAKDISDYSAVRHTLGAIREGEIFLDNHWTSKSGNLPSQDVLASFEKCKSEGLKLLTNYHQKVNSITEEKYEKTLEEFKAKFDSEDFEINNSYLEWFNGKDLATSIRKALSKSKIHLSETEMKEKYYPFAVERIDFSSKFEDFRDFKSRITNALTLGR